MLQVNQTINDLVANANADMRRFYGKDGTVVAAAPGRVNLIGEHIDYCDGFVLPLAIERYIVVSAKPNGTSEARLHSSDQPEAVVDLSAPQEISNLKWSNYIRGVVKGFNDLGHENKRLSHPLAGFLFRVVVARLFLDTQSML